MVARLVKKVISQTNWEVSKVKFRDHLKDHALSAIAIIIDCRPAKKSISVIIGRQISKCWYFVISLSFQELQKVVVVVNVKIPQEPIARKSAAIAIGIEIVAVKGPFCLSVKRQVLDLGREMIKWLKCGQSRCSGRRR